MTPTTIADLSRRLQSLLTVRAAELGRRSGFCQRLRKLSPEVFVQVLCFCWLADPTASLSAFVRAGAARGVLATKSAWDQRFGPAATEFLRQLLEVALQDLAWGTNTAYTGLLQRFPAIVLIDSTSVSLPACFASLWAGCGRLASTTAASLKVSLAYDLCSGGFLGLRLTSGRTNDRTALPDLSGLPAGSLRITDLGYFSLDAFEALGTAGNYFLSRLQSNLVVWLDGERVDLTTLARRLRRRHQRTARPVEAMVELGAEKRLPARLILVPVPPQVAAQRRAKLKLHASSHSRKVSPQSWTLAGYTLLVTNVPEAQLLAEEALILYRARWQIELVFKLWKTTGGLEQSISANPDRRLAEVYGKLLALVIGHWCLLACEHFQPVETSLAKAHAEVAGTARALLRCFHDPARFTATLDDLARSLRAGCELDTRGGRPSTLQRFQSLQYA